MTAPAASVRVEIIGDLGSFAADTDTKIRAVMADMGVAVDEGGVGVTEQFAATGVKASEAYGSAVSSGVTAATVKTTAAMTEGAQTSGAAAETEFAAAGVKSGEVYGTSVRDAIAAATATLSAAMVESARTSGGAAGAEFAEQGSLAGEKFAESAKETVKAASGTILAGIGALGLGEVVKGSIEAADDLEGANQRIENYFGESGKAVLAWATSVAGSLRESDVAVETGAANFGAFLTGLGVSKTDAAGLSEQLVTLSANMAAYNHTTTEATDAALESALKGRTVALKQYGVTLDQTAPQEALLAHGIDLSSDASKAGVITLTNQQKALGTLYAVLGATKDQQTGLAQTSDTLRAKQETLTADFKNFESTLGTEVMPVLTGFVGGLEDAGHWIAQNKAWLEPLVEVLGVAALAWKATNLAQAGYTAVSLTVRAAFGDEAAAATKTASTAEGAAAAQRTALQASVDAQVVALRELIAAYGETATAAEGAATKIAASDAEMAGGAGAAEGGLLGGAAGRGAGGALASEAEGLGAVAAAAPKAATALGGVAAESTVALGPIAALTAGLAYGGVELGKWLGAGPSSNAAVSAIVNIGSAVKAFTADLVDNGGALDQNAVNVAASQIQAEGLADRATKAGVSIAQLTTGVLGNNTQFKQLMATWEASGNPSQATINQMISLHDAFGKATDGAAALVIGEKGAADQAKGTSAAAADLTTMINNIKQNKVPTITANTASANALIKKLQADLNGIDQKNLPVIDVDTATAADRIIALDNMIANIPVPFQGGSTTNAHIDQQQAFGSANAAEGASNPGRVVVQPITDLSSGSGSGGGGGGGGGSDAAAAVKKAVATKVIQIPLPISWIADYSDEAQMKQAISVTVTGIGKAFQQAVAKGGSANEYFRANVGEAIAQGVADGIKDPAHFINEAVKTVAGTTKDAVLKDFAVADYIDAMNVQWKKLGVSIPTSIGQGIAEGGTSATTAVTNLGTLLKNQMATAKANLDQLEKQLNDDIASEQASIIASYSVAQMGATTVETLNADGTSSSSAGPVTASQIVSDMQSAVTQSAAFSANIKKLQAEGLNPTEIEQLVNAGPAAAAAQAAALAGASVTTIKQLNALQVQLAASAKAAATIDEKDAESAGIATAQGVIKGLQSETSELESAIASLGSKMLAAFKKALGISSPSKVTEMQVGLPIVQGIAKGISSNAGLVVQAAQGVVDPIMSVTGKGGAVTSAIGSAGSSQDQVAAAFAASNASFLQSQQQDNGRQMKLLQGIHDRLRPMEHMETFARGTQTALREVDGVQHMLAGSF